MTRIVLVYEYRNSFFIGHIFSGHQETFPLQVPGSVEITSLIGSSK